MPNDATQTETQTAPEPKAPTINDESLSFSDYQKLRRGESLPPVQAEKSAPAEKSAEQKTSDESETSETEAKEVEEDSEDREEVGTEKTDESEKDKSKKSGFQKRIDKLNARTRAAQQETEYWRQQALKGAGQVQDPAKVETKPVASEGKPDPDKFNTHAEFVEALADWKTDQKLKERDQKQEQAKLQADQANLLKSHADRVKAFKDKTDDFDEMLGSLDDVRSPVIQQIIVESENGPALLYELAKNPEEALRISKLTPWAIARELGKLESKITPASESEKKPETKKITNAPKPIETVGKNAVSSVRKSIDDPGLSFAEYEKLRREQMKRRRG